MHQSLFLVFLYKSALKKPIESLNAFEINLALKADIKLQLPVKLTPTSHITTV